MVFLFFSGLLKRKACCNHLKHGWLLTTKIKGVPTIYKLQCLGVLLLPFGLFGLAPRNMAPYNTPPGAMFVDLPNGVRRY